MYKYPSSEVAYNLGTPQLWMEGKNITKLRWVVAEAHLNFALSYSLKLRKHIISYLLHILLPRSELSFQ
jgi:hypothetical protein